MPPVATAPLYELNAMNFSGAMAQERRWPPVKALTSISCPVP